MSRALAALALAFALFLGGTAGVPLDDAVDAVSGIDAELTAEAASADPPGPQSYCTHSDVYWNVHWWAWDHYNTQDWYGNWRHVHRWHHYERPSMAHNYYNYKHTSSVYC